MNHFFDTLETASPLLATRLYGPEHLVWFLLFTALTVGLTALYYRLDDRRRDHMRLILGGLAAAIGLFKEICLFVGHVWHPAYLPFCFCSFGLILVFLHAVKNSEFVANILYTIYLPCAFIGLIRPYWLALPAKNFLFWFYFASHILLVIYPLMQAVGGDLVLHPRHIPRIAMLTLCLFIPIFALDVSLDLNFFFLVSPPEHHILQWFALHGGSHLLGYPVILGVLFFIMYGLSALVRLITAKVKKEAESQ